LENRRKALKALKDLHTERSSLFAQTYLRLHAFVPVLDHSFFAPALEVPLPGSEVAETDLTLLRHKQLEAEVQRCRAEVSTRQQQLISHIEELALLYSDLAIDPPLSVQPLLSDANPQPTAANLNLIASSLSALDAERISRETTIQSVYDRLYSLWIKLDVPEAYTEEFVDQHAGISAECIAAYEAELDRMEGIKRDNMAVWIQREREEVVRLRQVMYLVVEDGMDLDGEYSEEALEALEREKAELEAEFALKEPVLRVLAKYFGLLQEGRDLQVRSGG
jgi:protein regulator of cytokinesis 1